MTSNNQSAIMLMRVVGRDLTPEPLLQNTPRPGP